MRKFLVGIVSLLLLFGALEKAFAHSEIYETISVTGTSTTVQSLSGTLTTDTSWSKYTYVESIIVAEGTSGFRWIVNGTPTATLGSLLPDGGVLKLHTLYDMQNIRFESGSSTVNGTLTVHHSRSQQEPKGIQITK